MPINNGVIELYVAVGDEGGVTVQIFYNPVLTGGQVVPENQPIRNVNGAALRAINTSSRTATVQIDGPSGPFLGGDGSRVIQIPPAGLTATANQLRVGAGIQTRADVGSFSLSSPEGARKAQ